MTASTDKPPSSGGTQQRDGEIAAETTDSGQGPSGSTPSESNPSDHATPGGATSPSLNRAVEHAQVVEELPKFRRSGRSRPIIGPSLVAFGSLLWAFTVAGEFTTAGFIGEWVAVVALVTITTVVAVIALRRSRSGASRVPRLSAHIGLCLLTSSMFTVATAIMLGFASQLVSRHPDVAFTWLLLFESTAALLLGQRLTGDRGNASAPRRAIIAYGLLVLFSLFTAIHVVAVS